MTPDERVEAAARAVTCAMSGLGFVMPPAYARPIARAALSAAGVAELEAENARLREENREYEAQAEQADLDVRLILTSRTAARLELADLRAVVARVVRQGGGVAALREHLNAMPAPTQREST